MRIKLYFLGITLLLANLSAAQTRLKGTTTPLASVQIIELKKGTQANEKGSYEIELDGGGRFTLLVSTVGFESQRRSISIKKDETKVVDIQLRTSTNELQEVQVVGKTEGQQLKEQGIKIDVLSTRKIQTEAATLTELMNRTAGVRVRQVGGLGSAANVMINGFQGKAVKYFKDGIPVDYLGLGFNINLVPINILDRVEIYKGVLPTNLGADALGGAVNLVTKSNLNQYLDFSYEVASFNTHRASVNAFQRNKRTNTFVGFDTFYNRSDNNYEVTVKVIDDFTRTRSDARVRRFHDRFSNYYGELYAGVTNKPWADLLRVGLTYYRIDRQDQHGALMTEPFGQVTSHQHSWVPTLRYKKSWGKASFDQFVVFNRVQSSRIDTCHCTYTWYGKRQPNASRQGESDSDGSLSVINFDNLTARSYFSYQLAPHHKFDANAVYSSYTRLGSDPFGNKYIYSGRDILSVPAGYGKLVVSAGLESQFKKKFTNNLILKYFRFNTNGTDALFASAREEQVRNLGHRFGMAEALKWTLSENSFLRFSTEYATRLPENTEIFGDGLFEMSNFALQPEQSLNVNLGYRSQRYQKYSVEFNGFYRRAKDLIVQVPTNIIFSQHQNVDKVQGFGVEADANYNFTPWLAGNFNLTYQDLRLFGIENPSTRFLEGSRVRNTPYFFGGASLKSSHRNLFASTDLLQAYWYYTYVNEFYLEPIPRASEAKGFLGIGASANINSELVIPTQHLHTIGANYSFPQEKISIGIEVKNLLNDDLFDNFRVQRAGRSFHLKVRYVLN